MPLAITPTFSPWTHTSDDSYIYQPSLVLATAIVSFFSCIPVCLSPSCLFVYAAAICYSQQVQVRTLMIRCFSACVICTLSHLRIILFFFVYYFFRSSYFSGGVSFCCALVPGTLALDLPTFILGVWFLCLSLWPNNLYFSRMKNQEGHWGYCWFR